MIRRTLLRGLAFAGAFWAAGGACPDPAAPGSPTPPPSFQALPASQGAEWARSIRGFEATVTDQARSLEEDRRRLEKLGSDIDRLESKTAALRDRAGDNLLDQLQLKKALSDLQAKLQAQASLRQERDDRRADLEQQGTSLMALYNEEIGRQLDLAAEPDSGNHLEAVIDTVRKRAALQALLARFPEEKEDGRMPSLSLLGPPEEKDLASLSTTLDILQQREKVLKTRIEREDVRQAELDQEAALQSKMRDLLSDVRRMNEDSSAPRESLNRSDLQALEGQAEDSNVRRGIEAARQQQARDRRDLDQVQTYIRSVRSRIDQAKGGGSQ